MAVVGSLSKEEYLKRYMSGPSDDGGKKKKKRRKIKAAVKQPRSRIIDEDVDFNSLLPSSVNDTLDDELEEGPTVADFVDERPDHIKLLEEYQRSDKWKVIKTDDATREGQLGSETARHDSDSDQSPVHRQRHDSDSDQSPVRTQRHDSDSDQSPVRTKKNYAGSDQSPVRRQRHDSGSDQSPPRRQRHGSDSDLSPPRQSSQNVKSHSKRLENSESDQSPPRRKRNDSSSDQSPPRRRKHGSESDQSPPRRKRHASDSDQSPPRKRKHGHDSDQSLSRKNRHGHVSPQSGQKKQSKSDSKTLDSEGRATKTMSGATAGLSTAEAMRQEAHKIRKKEDEEFKKIGDDLLGKNAQTVFRERGGKRRNLKEERLRQREEDAKKAELEEKYMQWGTGLKQKEDQKQTLEDTLHEMSKPLARYRDDEDLDEMLRNKDREGDPMLAFMKKKKGKAGGAEKGKPQYRGPAPPPNRFGIQPGYRWDGVNRSNGFEKQFFAKIAERKATSEMAYKWSVEDM